MPSREIPYHDYALHTPDPRRHFLDTLLTPMLRRLDVQGLFAGFEQHLNRPPPGELTDHPAHTGLEVGCEQVTVAHRPRPVTHHHDLDRPKPQHVGPYRLVTDRLQLPLFTVGQHGDGPPQPRAVIGPLAVGPGRRLFGAGQAWPFLGLGAAFALSRRGGLWGVQSGI